MPATTVYASNFAADVDLPIGSLTAHGSTSVPGNYLLCDGSAISRTTYASLFAVIGTTWGAGNGTTTFNLPDLTGKCLVGKAASGTFVTLGSSGGSETHTHTCLAHSHSLSHNHAYSHNHAGTLTADPDHAHTSVSAGAVNSSGSNIATANAGTHNHTIGFGNAITDTQAPSSASVSSAATLANNTAPYLVHSYVIKVF